MSTQLEKIVYVLADEKRLHKMFSVSEESVKTRPAFDEGLEAPEVFASMTQTFVTASGKRYTIEVQNDFETGINFGSVRDEETGSWLELPEDIADKIVSYGEMLISYNVGVVAEMKQRDGYPTEEGIDAETWSADERFNERDGEWHNRLADEAERRIGTGFAYGLKTKTYKAPKNEGEYKIVPPSSPLSDFQAKYKAMVQARKACATA